MSCRKISFETMFNMMGLIKASYRPREILELEKKLEEKRSLADKIRTEGGCIAYELHNEIFEINKQIDMLFLDWGEGRLE